MNLLKVMKTELYKICHRKSSLMLVIPILLAAVITWGYSQGVIKLDLTATGDRVYTCMDFVFIVWTVLSGLGIMGILFILFAAFQFSGEIEHGQIKLMILRIGKRNRIILGKYLALLLMVCVTIMGTLVACAVSYYLLISSSEMGTGTFGATIGGASTVDIFIIIILQILMYLVLIGLTFLIGLFANPFVTFVLTMLWMYAGNYLAGTESFAAKLLPEYWGNQIILNGSAPVLQIILSVAVAFMASVVIIIVSTGIFRTIDIK